MSDQGVLKARDVETGEVVSFRWNDPNPPTDADMDEIFKEHRARATSKTDAAAHPFADAAEGLKPLAEGVVGAGKGILRGITGAGDAIRRAAPWTKALDVDTGGSRANLEPTGTAQKVGAAMGEAALSAIPAVRGAQGAAFLTRGLPAAARLGAQMVTGAATNAATGQAFGHESAKTDAMVGAAGPMVGAAAIKGARWIGSKAEPLARAALKTPLRILREQVGASKQGADAMASKIANTVLNNRFFNADKADDFIDVRMGKIDDEMVKNAAVPTDAPSRTMDYLQEIHDAAQKAPGTARVGAQSAVEAERAAVLAGDYAHDVQVGTRQVPSSILGPNGQPVMQSVPNMQRQVKPSVPVSEARAATLASARFDPKKWGGFQGAGEPSKAVELASRDAVKEALPQTKPLFEEVAPAMPARDALRLMHVRDAGRDTVGPYRAIGAIQAAASGSAMPLEVGMLAQLYKNNQLRLGIYARDIEKILQSQDKMAAARMLQKLGVSLTSQAADVPREGAMTITEPK
jgi:hypothetical protein